MAYLVAVERELDLSAGASVMPGDPDDIQLDSEPFVGFVAKLEQVYSRSNHGIFRRELSPVLFPAIVMLQLSGHGARVFPNDPDQRDQIAACKASMTSL